MGWNSWDSYGGTLNEESIKANAMWMAKNLKRFGWEYVVDAWTTSLLTNPEVIAVDQHSTDNRPVITTDNIVFWTARPTSGRASGKDSYVAIFNISDTETYCPLRLERSRSLGPQLPAARLVGTQRHRVGQCC